MQGSSPVFKSRFQPWLLLLPSVLILLLFAYYPAIQSFVASLYRTNLLLGTRRFIGVENFVALFTGPFAPAYRQVLGQSLLFSACVVFFGLAISLFLAVLANQPIRGARIYRLLLIWPFALSPAIAGVVFSFMFNPEVGLVNQILSATLGLKPRWLDTPVLAFVLVVSAAIWKNIGYNIVFYLAALQNIPRELSEAAEIDGANPLQRFFAITFPMLSPMTFFLLFTNLTYSFFDTFGLIDVLTRGGPIGPEPFNNAGLTTNLAYKLVQDGFTGSGNVGFAATQSIVLLLLVVIFTIMQFRYGSRNVHYGG
jgi:sn-glycerol 3-phosphate transport system permease protein